MASRAARVLVVPLLALAAVSFLPGARAVADTPDDAAKTTARTKLVEGGEFLKQGEYSSALSRFQEAYDLVHSPKIEYNFGLAYMGLGRKADAAEAFEKFLTEATDANPDLRANAERHRSTLGQQVGTLIIECDANGAEISVDGRSRGVTPLATPIRLDPGPHQLVIEKTGAPPFAEKFTAVAGKRLTVQARLGAEATPPVVSQTKPEVVPPPIVPVVSEPTPEEKARALKKKLAWGAGAAAVVTFGVGVVMRLRANSSFHDFNTRDAPYGKCDADDRVRDHGGGDCSDLLSAGRSSATISTIAFIGAGAFGATSAVLFYLTRKAPEQAAPTTGFGGVACAPDLFRAGLACNLRF